MLKQKKILLLLVTVLIVWGIIGFQIFSYLNPEEEIFKEPSVATFKPIVKQAKETYVVKKHRRDPFLGKLLIQPKKIKKVIRKKEPINFPTIVFNGLVESNRKKTFVLTINGEQKIVKVGQVFKEVKLLKGTASEVLLSYKGKRKLYKKMR
ncbi:hypothetical protein [Tenacibaculum sp. C7A-26P2]|uniref:hypothetical protein n=1 Tax=Tenacibaculum sp. C7A-26P2 TaxID=3447504 RepID=UPI003F855C08